MLNWVCGHFLSRTLSITFVGSEMKVVIGDLGSFINDISWTVSGVVKSNYCWLLTALRFLFWIAWAKDLFVVVGMLWFSELLLGLRWVIALVFFSLCPLLMMRFWFLFVWLWRFRIIWIFLSAKHPRSLAEWSSIKSAHFTGRSLLFVLMIEHSWSP